MEETQEHPLDDRPNEEEQQRKAGSNNLQQFEKSTRVLSVIGQKNGRTTRNGKRDWDLPRVFDEFTTNTTDALQPRPNAIRKFDVTFEE
ncbi:hypothetical protein BLNAU_13946 [Blattamonas nauphoetae]|uniref:Uncharacterized protein n=1 Tax=Blattamonas nauphoetae TaxID=2049346 RepID=A0ABQ9XF72_9EUKA|nr:hypothetical protein BLNAU_13946 [Blattamonas nauphoetae]